MSDAPDGGVLTFGAFDIVVFAAIVYLVTKLVRRVTGAPTSGPKLRKMSADTLAAADATALAAGTKTTQQLIVGLPELASADEAERLPATAHLAAVLSNLQSANAALPQAAADHSLTFLTSRLHDYPCSAPVLGGLHALVDHTHELDAALVQTLTFTLLEEVDVRSLVQAERRRRSRSRSRSRRNGGPRSRRRACGCALGAARLRRRGPAQPDRLPPAAARAHAPLRRRAAGGARRRGRRDLRRVGAPAIEFSPPPGDPHGVTQPHIVQAYIRALKASAKFRRASAVAAGQARRRRPARRDPAGTPGARAPRARVRRRRRRAARPRLSLGLARCVTKLAGIAPDSPLTAAVGECARAVACAAAGDAQFQIVAAPVDAALAEPPASAGADHAASVLRALLRTPAAPLWSSVRSPMPSRVADGGRPRRARTALLLALLRAVIDGDGGGGGDAEAGAADGDAAEAEDAAEASRTACVAAIAAGRRPLLESPACCNDEPAAGRWRWTPAAAAAETACGPAAHSICLALRAARCRRRRRRARCRRRHCRLRCKPLPQRPRYRRQGAARCRRRRRRRPAARRRTLAVEISRLRAALLPSRWPPYRSAVNTLRLRCTRRCSRRCVRRAGVDDRAAATPPAVARRWRAVRLSGRLGGGRGARCVIQTRLRAVVGGGDAHALRAVCASVQALTAAPPAQMSAVTKWLCPTFTRSLPAAASGSRQPPSPVALRSASLAKLAAASVAVAPHRRR